MKNSKLRVLIAILTVVAVVLTTCGIGSIVFADVVPEPFIANDGSGTGKNTGSLWTYTASYVENAFTGGKAINLKGTNSGTAYREGTFNLAEYPNPEKITAFSMYVEVPFDTNWSLRVNDYALGFQGPMYAINNDGEFVKLNGTLLPAGFKGRVIYFVPAEDTAVKVLWAKTISGTPYSMNTTFTWDEFLTKFGGLKSIKMYIAAKTSPVDQTIVVDEITYYFDSEQGLLERFNLALDAPVSAVTGGLVSKGIKIDLTAEDGADIYYTVDGTVPDKTSTKYDPQNMPVINEDTVLKAIAYKGELQSLVTKYEYACLPDSYPNVTVMNPAEDTSTMKSDGSHDGTTSIKTIVQGVSPYGDAIRYLGLGGSGASMWNVKNVNKLPKEEMAAHEAFGFWVSVPEGTNVKFSPCINGEKYSFNGKCITYNTSTQEVIEYADRSKYPSLSGFEGYLIFSVAGECVRTTWNNNGPHATWRDHMATTDFNQICFYQSHAGLYNKTWVIDNVVAIKSIQQFITDMNAQPSRPMAPTADPGSDAVKENTQIFLYAEDGCEIYYTLDETLPTFDADGNCTNGKLYSTYSMGNGQPDASYIELREDTVVTAVSKNIITNVVSGVAKFEYTIEMPYEGPNEIVLNNGTGEGTNTLGWYSTTVFDTAVVDNDSPDGKGHGYTIKTPNSIATAFHFKVDSSNVEQVHNFKGYSFHVSVPDLPKESYKFGFASRVNGEKNYLCGKVYAISDDGETIIQGENSVNFSKAFSGTVYMVFDENEAVAMQYGAVKTTWYKFIKANVLTSFGFYFTRPKMDQEVGEPYDQHFVLDDFTLIYDMDKCFEDIGLEGLLATYDAGSFENTNMIVLNDGSGNAKNAGLTGFTESLVIEKTDYSFDERSLKLTMPAGESFIKFAGTSSDEKLVIGAGTTFWVEMPKGAGATALDLELYDFSAEGTELYEYAEKFFYLIDKDGVISKHTGELIVPDGFRGWIVIPKETMFISEAEGYTIANAELDYNQVTEVKVIFRNKKNELKGKTVHIDDISVYTDFTALVQSRALKWEGQVFK